MSSFHAVFFGACFIAHIAMAFLVHSRISQRLVRAESDCRAKTFNMEQKHSALLRKLHAEIEVCPL